MRLAVISATIWQNIGEYDPYFTVTFSRPVRGQAGAWRNFTSFTLRDLDTIAFLNAQAKEWIAVNVHLTALSLLHESLRLYRRRLLHFHLG